MDDYVAYFNKYNDLMDALEKTKNNLIYEAEMRFVFYYKNVLSGFHPIKFNSINFYKLYAILDRFLQSRFATEGLYFDELIAFVCFVVDMKNDSNELE